MMNDYIFTNDLWLFQDQHLTNNIITSSNNYKIDTTDAHLLPLHGKLYDIVGQEETSREVSFLTFQYIHTASNMRRQLDRLFTLAPLNVARTYCVSPIKALQPPTRMLIGSIQMEIPSTLETDKPCLMIEQVSTLTFDVWHLTASKENLTLLFRSLCSAVGKFHQDGKYFGNIRKGIRISGNHPIFVYPAVFEDTKCDQGIRNDLRELHGMVLESRIPGVHEKNLFDKLCNKYVGNNTYSSESLREGSFLITHCPVVWTATDRYNFIRKLGEYKNINKDLYRDLTTDHVLDQAIPVDFWTRIEKPVSSSAFKLNEIYRHGRTTTYTSTESIRYFHRCAYEHNLAGYPLRLDMENLLYSVFPEAPAGLYEMMINRICYPSNPAVNIQGSMLPSIIEFLQSGPHKFDF